MADGKSDLRVDLLSSKPFDRSWTGKVETFGGTDEKPDESKDQLALESSIPLSPQWLYAKPSDTKMESRGLPSDPNSKEGWRLDGSQDRKDWRRTVTENESSRRWREEERETGLLSGRRDRRKGERRVENVSSRETVENRVISSSDRWHDGNFRNPGHESRRDNKWSLKWGPEEKEKESHTSEKRTDTDKEKVDAHNENQSIVSNNRPTSERDLDSSRDKWRPRHRMEVHSGGSTTTRAAPGFGLERGKAESHNPGFALGRGRGTFLGRSSSAGPIGAVDLLKDGDIPGKSKCAALTFCYPRGKLLDIYRHQKIEKSSFHTTPDVLEEASPITRVDHVEPLAFIAPDAEEEGILNEIWKGKITSSGVSYHSFKQGRIIDNASAGDSDTTEKTHISLPDVLSGGNLDALQETAVDNAFTACRIGSSSNNEMFLNMVDGKEFVENGGSKSASAAFQSCSDDGVENVTTFDIKEKHPDESSSIFLFSSSDENVGNSGWKTESGMEAKSFGAAPKELTLFYIDPQGNTQGPFLGADIVSWFKQGFFGTDLLVRLVDSPEGTPFQELGEIMPQLDVEYKQGNVNGLNPILEESGSLGSKLEAVHTSSSMMKSLSTGKLFQASPQFSGLSAQHAQSMISDPEAKLQFQPSNGQSFEDSLAHDEEIVFPGRSGHTHPIAKSSWGIHDQLINSGCHPSLQNELTEASFPNENDNKLHRFGLLWSELEGSQIRHSQSSNVPSGVRRSAPLSTMIDPGLDRQTWPDNYGEGAFPDSNIYQDALAAAHMSQMERESNHFDIRERLISQQLQQQQLQQNMLSDARLNESLLEHPGHNLIHQRQLSNHAAPDLEHLMALQMQQQRQLEIQQQQFHQEQKLLQERQQFHREQKLLQERQRSQVQQIFLEQLLCGQGPVPGLRQSHADPFRSSNVLDQVLLEQQFLREQQSHHASRNGVPSLEQIVQAKFGLASLEDHQRDPYDLIPHAQHGDFQSLEHQFLQQEQLHRQLSMTSKQHYEERDIDSLWQADQTNQFLRNSDGTNRQADQSNHFLRNSGGINRVHSSSFNPLDLYQQQRPFHEDQLTHLERNLSLRDRIQQGRYEHSSSPFEHSMSLPAGASGINMEVANAVARGRGLEMDDISLHLQSAGEVGSFSSGHYTHNPHHSVHNQYSASQHANDGHWADSNGQMGNDWMESQIQHPQINAERQKRDQGVKVPSESSSSWMSDGVSDDLSRQLLMELLHQKSGHQTTASTERAPSGIDSGSLGRSFNVLADQGASMHNLIPNGSYVSNSSEAQRVYLADEPGSLESDERLQTRHGSSYISMPNELSDGAWKNHGAISQGMRMETAFEVQDGGAFKHGRPDSAGERNFPVNILSRHSSPGIAGGDVSAFREKIGIANSYFEDVAKDRLQVPAKAQDSMMLRRPPMHASSPKEGLSTFVSDPASWTKNSLSGNDGGKRDTGGNLGSQGTETVGKKEGRFLRTSSFGEGDVSEASFIDMLKSNSKKSTAPDVHAMTGAESVDGTQGGRSGKKKGKKGRQIDPALLGFKVTSNRILMGEIQRLND